MAEKVVITCLVAFFVSLFCVWITESRLFNKICGLINHKSIHEDIWRDIIDYDGTTLVIFCKNETISYTGKLYAHEEKGSNSWFVLTDYIVQYKQDGKILNSKDILSPTTVAINLKDVDRIELYYNKETKILN